MAESRLPVPLSRPAPARRVSVPWPRGREQALHPAVRALATTAAELAPDLIRLARRAWQARSGASQRQEAREALSSAELTYTEVRVKVFGPARRIVLHQTSMWSLPLHEETPHTPAVRRIGLGLAGLAGALVLLRFASRRRPPPLPLPRRQLPE